VKNKIRIYRAQFELTQEELAEKVGVTRQTILAIEKNKYLPSLLLAVKIARVFGKTVEDIFDV
jgi:putative transcriptional regulator